MLCSLAQYPSQLPREPCYKNSGAACARALATLNMKQLPVHFFHIQSQSQTHTPPFACARFYYSFLFLIFKLFAISLLVACYLLPFTMCAQWFVLTVGDGWRLVGLGLMGSGVACPHFTRTYGCPGNRQPFCFGILVVLSACAFVASTPAAATAAFCLLFLNSIVSTPVLHPTKPSLKVSWCFDTIHTFLLYPTTIDRGRLLVPCYKKHSYPLS